MVVIRFLLIFMFKSLILLCQCWSLKESDHSKIIPLFQKEFSTGYISIFLLKNEKLNKKRSEKGGVWRIR